MKYGRMGSCWFASRRRFCLWRSGIFCSEQMDNPVKTTSGRFMLLIQTLMVWLVVVASTVTGSFLLVRELPSAIQYGFGGGIGTLVFIWVLIGSLLIVGGALLIISNKLSLVAYVPLLL